MPEGRRGLHVKDLVTLAFPSNAVPGEGIRLE